MAFQYRVFGSILVSNLVIPYLLPLSETGSSDLTVHFGVRPPEPVNSSIRSEPQYASPYVDADNLPIVKIWRLPNSNRYVVEYANGLEFVMDVDRAEIWASWRGEASQEDAISFLLGPVMGLFLRLRGETCLHASAVSFSGRAIVFVGPPGAGKSTTAAALNYQGFPTISDDVVLLREDERGDFYAIPAHPSLTLWPESVEMLGQSLEALPRVYPKLDKRRWVLTGGKNQFETRVLPIGMIYILSDLEDENRGLTRHISLQEALMALVVDTYGTYALDPDRRAQEFNVLGRLVKTVPVRTLEIKKETPDLEKICRVVLDDASKAYAALRGDSY